MSEGYTKLLSSIRHSSIWIEPDDVLRVWMTLLTMADQHGYVWACADGIAHESRTVTESRVIEILDMFQSPDPRSRSTDFEGRRVQKVDRGWLVLNYEKIRNMHSDGAERARKREWWASNRGKSKPLDASVASETLAYGSGSDISGSDLSYSDLNTAKSMPGKKRTARSTGPIPPPDQFEPTPATARCAEKYKRDLQSDWEDCSNWHLKKGTQVHDWQATLRTWMKRASSSTFASQRATSCPDRIEFTERHRGLCKRMSREINLAWSGFASDCKSKGITLVDWSEGFSRYLVTAVERFDLDVSRRSNGPQASSRAPGATTVAPPATETRPAANSEHRPGAVKAILSGLDI